MGRNKVFIKINGVFLIDRIIEELEKLSKNIILVVDKKEKYAQINRYGNIKILEDENRGIGPAEGMRIGLKIRSIETLLCAHAICHC